MSDLLISPMHRCTKVPLLLNNIRRYTEDPDERHQLTESLEKLETSLSKIFSPKTRTISVLTRTALKYFCINHGDERVSSIWNHPKNLGSFQCIWILMLWVYGHYKYFNYFSAGSVFRRQNQTSTDVRFWRIKTIPTLKELYLSNTIILYIHTSAHFYQI